MKLIHLSDLHFGKNLGGFSLVEDQEYIIGQILDIIRKQAPDGIMIAGDIYDKSNPSDDAVRLFDDFLTGIRKLNIPVFIISGNHDSGEKLSCYSRIIEEQKIYISGVYNGTLKQVAVSDEYGDVNFVLMPFVRKSDVKDFFPDEKIDTLEDAVKVILEHTEIDETKRNVILVHQFIKGCRLNDDNDTVNVGSLEYISASLFDKFDYVALGHIHRPQNIVRNRIRYCGSPIKYSSREIDHKKSVTVVNLAEKGNVSVEEVPLEPLHDMVKIKGRYDELTSKKFYDNLNKDDDYFYIQLTDEQDICYGYNKMNVIYPKIIQFEYDRQGKNIQEVLQVSKDIKRIDPFDIVCRFYKEMRGKDPDENQLKYIKETLQYLKETKK